MDTINKLIVLLIDNLFSVVIVTVALVVLWASVGTDVRTPNQGIGGLSKTVKNEMEILVPSKN